MSCKFISSKQKADDDVMWELVLAAASLSLRLSLGLGPLSHRGSLETKTTTTKYCTGTIRGQVTIRIFNFQRTTQDSTDTHCCSITGWNPCPHCLIFIRRLKSFFYNPTYSCERRHSTHIDIKSCLLGPLSQREQLPFERKAPVWVFV